MDVEAVQLAMLLQCHHPHRPYRTKYHRMACYRDLSNMYDRQPGILHKLEGPRGNHGYRRRGNPCLGLLLPHRYHRSMPQDQTRQLVSCFRLRILTVQYLAVIISMFYKQMYIARLGDYQMMLNHEATEEF